jgi:hypothetical protein
MEHFSLKRLRGEGLRERGAASLGTLEDRLRKALVTSISPDSGPFKTEGNLESGVGGLYTRDFER